MASREEKEMMVGSDTEAVDIVDLQDSIDVVDNGAGLEIENILDDLADPVDVDEDPYIVRETDADGVPGDHPYHDASQSFEQAAGLEDEDEQDDENDASEEVLGDEFAARLLQREDATVSGDGRPVDDLAMLAQVAQAQHDADAGIAPYRRINPPSASGGLLGGRATVPVGADPVQVINWVGKDIEALPVTISAFPIGNGLTTNNPALGTSFTYNQVSFITVTWGTRDGAQSAQIDVGSGVQITVVASVVYVSVGNSIDQNSGDTISPAPAAISASLGFYTGNKADAATFTSYMRGPGEAIVTIPRPPFASHFYYARTNAANTATLNVQFSGGNSCYIITVPANTTYVGPFKLPNDCTSIVVTENAGTFDEARLMWGLYL